MKTIEVTDELYDKLMGIANEMVTQDNRATAPPHLFQIRTKHRVYDTGLNGDEMCFVNLEGDYETYDSVEELIEYFKDNEIEYPSDIEQMWSHSYWSSDDPKFDGLTLGEFIDEKCKGFERSSYSWEYKYENAFLTEKSCKEHIEKNHYHYKEPVDYLAHAFRNHDMNVVTEFFHTLAKKQ